MLHVHERDEQEKESKMSKRRICLTAKSYSLPFLDVSPSKKRSVHRRTLSTNLSNSSPVVSPPEGNSVPQQTNAEGANSEESAGDDNPLGFDFTEQSTSSYYERQQKSADYWSEMWEGVLYAAMEVSGFPYSSVECIVCDQTATAVCYDCGPRAFFCDDHIEIFHSTKINIFHIPQICKVY